MATSVVDVHQLQKLRHLGKLEEFSSARHHLGFFLNVGISTSYTYESDGPIDLRESIFSALSEVIRQHPILSAIPVDEDSPLPTLPFAVLATADSHRSQSENEFVASFIYHHALGDGASGIIFQKHFYLALMSDPLPLKNKIISPPMTALLLNLELLHPLPIPAPPSSTPSNPWTAGPIHVPMRTVIQTLIILKDLTSQFLHTCRARSTTLTSTLSFLVARALAEVLPLDAREFKGTIPVNIRRFLPRDRVTDDDMGVWIDTMPIYYCRENLSVETLWKEAQRTRDVISTYLASSGQPSSEQPMNVARMKQRGDMREVFLSMVGQERDSTFEVSNLGVVKADEAGSGAWKIGGFGFSRSAFAAGAVFSIGVITGCDGCLNMGFSWLEGVMERKVMRRTVEGVRAEIERVVGQ